MIEFKADCGHTVRAKDDDAGKVVRCAYCGREAQVPDDEARDDFDFLFSDIAGESGGEVATKSRRGKKVAGAAAFKRGPRSTDPFSIITRMAYVAVALILVIFVGKKYAWPFIEDAFLTQSKQPAQTSPLVTSHQSPPKPISAPPPSRKVGLLDPDLEKRQKEGLHIITVPERVTVFYRADDGTDPKKKDRQWVKSWVETPETKRLERPPYTIDLEPGTYDIIVALPINDPDLKRYENFGYEASFRTKIGLEVDDRDGETADAYLRPDTAQSVYVLRIGSPIYVARRYQVTVRRRDWQVMSALFVPRCCSIGADLKQFLPKRNVFAFDDADIASELHYYGVSDIAERPFVIDILHEIGSISVWVSDKDKGPDKGQYFMFSIEPVKGIFVASKLERYPDRGKTDCTGTS